MCVIFYVYVYFYYCMPEYEISASAPPPISVSHTELLASNIEPDDGLYIGRNM